MGQIFEISCISDAIITFCYFINIRKISYEAFCSSPIFFPVILSKSRVLIKQNKLRYTHGIMISFCIYCLPKHVSSNWIVVKQWYFLQKPNESESQNGNIQRHPCNVDERSNSICDTGIATPGGLPTRSRPSSKMTKYVECWGADKPFANIAESTLAKNIELTVSNLFL